MKTFLQILEKEAFFAKFRTMILNITKIHKNPMKKLTSGVLCFKIERKYESCREKSKIKRFLNQVKLVKNINLNSFKLMKIFRVTMLSLKYFEKVGLKTT